MNDQLDIYLQQNLRRWANAQQPPKNGRARLLMQAASPFYRVETPLEECIIDQPRPPKTCLGYPQRDLLGMVEFLWAAQIHLPAIQTSL